MSLNEAAFGEAGRAWGPGFRAARGEEAVRPAAGWADRLEAALDAERGRWFLWLPVFFGLGIAVYFSLPSEPPFAVALAAVMLAFVFRLFCRLTTFRLIASSIVLTAALGFMAVKIQALIMNAPVLERTRPFVELEGWVEDTEVQDKRTRLTIRLIGVRGLTAEKTPRRVRISMRGKQAPPLPGEAIRARATLMPPPEPALPGGFDFARTYWFQGIGASGYVTGKIERLEKAPRAPLDLRLSSGIARLRHAISARIRAVVGGDTGAIAKALTVGERGEISEKAWQHLRDAGLAHVISISGFHMALTAGSAFWLIRALLALFPAIALRYPIKVWAAVGALVIASAYLAISGSAVTAVRSYIMVAILFIAVILNRPAISQRNLAFSALLILIFMPQSLADPGFQMSFAATAALIAFYEAHLALRPLAGWPALIALPLTMLIEAVLTTLAAGAACDPIAAYHFHRIAIYSVIGNLLAGPVVAIVVMPMALLALLAMPFGLETWPIIAMDRGIGVMMMVAEFASSLPSAAVLVPAFAAGAFPLMVGGGLWLLIWQGRWRWLGLVGVGAGLALAPFGSRPDIWVDRNGGLVAIRDPSGVIVTPDTRKGAFSLERWMEADGDGRPVKAARGSKSFQCDPSSCIALVKGKLVSHVVHPSALADDCRRAAILIANFPLPERCAQPEVVIDSLDLKERGAHTLEITEAGVIVSTVASERGRRPWIIPFKRKETIPAVAPESGGADSGDEAGGAEAENPSR
jgi:competence protein ComEC